MIVTEYVPSQSEYGERRQSAVANRRKIGDPEARRRHLLCTTRSLVQQHGFHRTSVKEIATAANIAVGQIYRDFANKEEIIALLCKSDISARLDVERLDKAINANDARTVAELLAAFCRRKASAAEARMMSEIIAESGRNQHVADIVRQCRNFLHNKMAAALAVARWNIDAAEICDLLFARDLMQIFTADEGDISRGSDVIEDIIEKAITNVNPN